LSEEQLLEAALHLHYYAGWANGTQVMFGVRAVLREHAAAQEVPKTR
jgi:alkylhydroperoxidase/carboxymuconolactone decarboxylase family protein YurZ